MKPASHSLSRLFPRDRVNLGRQIERGVGFVVGLTKRGPASRDPRLHDLLLRAGVLQRDPSSWEDSPILDGLPWGAERVKAPPATPPLALEGPWPQAPVFDPEMYPPVLNIDPADRKDHFLHNVTRYLGQVTRHWPAAAQRARLGPRLVPLTDERFTEILTRTSLGQFVTLDLEARDRSAFAAVLAGAPERHAKADFSFMPAEAALPGVHVAPTVTLFRRDADRYVPVAIRVGERIFTPNDGPSWELARYFVLQGAQTRLVNSTHARLHFPADVISAIGRSVLPAGHVVHRLLVPHAAFTPGLHEAVIHHRRSVLHNSQRELYTPFAFTTEGIHALVVVGRNGLPGTRAYPAYRFGEELFGAHVPYGQFRQDWFDLYLQFTKEVLSGVGPDDVHVRAFADHVHTWLPSFPTGDAIFEGDTLPRALASHICTLSVYHSGDHHSYSAIPPAQLPWRIRIPSPDVQAPGSLDPSALVSAEDHFRHLLCHPMFFAPVIRRSVREVSYQFRQARARRAEENLHAGMETLDARWARSGFPSSREIACSVQY